MLGRWVEWERGHVEAECGNRAKNSLFLSPKERALLSPKLGPVWGPQHPQPCPLSLALLADPRPALQHPTPLPSAKGRAISLPMDLDAHIQLTAQQWRQLCGCRPAECLNYKTATRAFPRCHAHSQPVGLQEHRPRSCRWAGAVAGLLLDRPACAWGILSGLSIPARRELASLSHPGGRQGQGALPGLALTKGAGTPLAQR